MAKKITTTKNIVVFDIDSASIAGGVFSYGYNEKGGLEQVRELYRIRESITDGRLYDFETYFARTLKACERTAHQVMLQSRIELDDIVINVSAPWVSSQKRVINYSEKKPFEITDELLDTLVAQEIDTEFTSNITYKDHDVELLDRKTIDLYVNGYPSRKPVGKKASEIAIHSLTSVISSVTKKAFDDVIESVFHRLPRYIPNTFVAYMYVRDNHPDVNDAIVIDVSGELSQVSIINDDHLRSFITFPAGYHHIYRDMAERMNIPLAKAQRMIHLHYDGHLEETQDKKVAESLEHGFSIWYKALYSAVDSIAKEGLLPKTIILKTDNNTHAWLGEKILQEPTLRQHLHVGGSIEMVAPALAMAQDAKLEVDDTELGIVALYIAMYE